MFKQLISSLAFSPSAIEQVSFYAKRLKQEDSIRRLGLILIVFSMFIQVFAAMIPPEKSLALSDNDVISGGVQNMEELKTKSSAMPDVKALYDRFGLQENSMNTTGSAQETTFDFAQEGANGTRTVGRTNFGSTNDYNLGDFAGSTFYSRNAGEWPGSTQAFYFDKQIGTDSNFYYVWVLKDSGNIAYQLAENSTPPTTSAATTAPATPAAPAAVLAPDRLKSAQNLTRQLTPQQTLSTKAKAGDTIEYTLTTTNRNDTELKDYLIEDYVGDLLDYATVDTAFLSQQGGMYSAISKKVSWPGQTILARSELKKTFRIALMPVIPSTNQPNATATNYDCKLQNGYGNETVIPVNCSSLKTIDELPETGAGTSIGIAFAVSLIAGYFYMRGRLLSKELRIIKKSHQSGY